MHGKIEDAVCRRVGYAYQTLHLSRGRLRVSFQGL